MDEELNNPRELKEIFKNISPDFYSYLMIAQKFSKTQKHFFIGVEHLFAAFLSEQKSLLRKSLQDDKANWKKKIQDFLTKAYNPQKRQKLWEGFLITPRVQRIWKEAITKTEFKDSTQVQEAHFLSILLQDEESFPYKWLKAESYNIEDIFENITQEIPSFGTDIREQSADEEIHEEPESYKPEPENKQEELIQEEIPAETGKKKKGVDFLKTVSVQDLFKKPDRPDKPDLSKGLIPSKKKHAIQKEVPEEAVEIGNKMVPYQYLRERGLTDRIIEEVHGISKRFGGFPEVLKIGNREVTFEELLDMGFDEEAYITFLEKLKNNFMEYYGRRTERIEDTPKKKIKSLWDTESLAEVPSAGNKDQESVKKPDEVISEMDRLRMALNDIDDEPVEDVSGSIGYEGSQHIKAVYQTKELSPEMLALNADIVAPFPGHSDAGDPFPPFQSFADEPKSEKTFNDDPFPPFQSFAEESKTEQIFRDELFKPDVTESAAKEIFPDTSESAFDLAIPFEVLKDDDGIKEKEKKESLPPLGEEIIVVSSEYSPVEVKPDIISPQEPVTAVLEIRIDGFTEEDSEASSAVQAPESEDSIFYITLKRKITLSELYERLKEKSSKEAQTVRNRPALEAQIGVTIAESALTKANDTKECIEASGEAVCGNLIRQVEPLAGETAQDQLSFIDSSIGNDEASELDFPVETTEGLFDFPVICNDVFTELYSKSSVDEMFKWGTESKENNENADFNNEEPSAILDVSVKSEIIEMKPAQTKEHQKKSLKHPLIARKSEPLKPEVLQNISDIKISSDFPENLWTVSEIDSIISKVHSSEKPVAVVLKSRIKRDQFIFSLQNLNVKNPENGKNQEFFLVRSEFVKDLSSESMGEKLKSIEKHLSRNKDAILIHNDLKDIFESSNSLKLFEESFENLGKQGNHIVAVFEKTQYDEICLKFKGFKKLFSSFNIDDVSSSEARNFLMTSVQVIEEKLKIKIARELLEQAVDLTEKYLPSNIIYPDGVIELFKKAAELKKEEFMDMDLDEIECVDRKDFLCILSDV